MSMTKLFKDTDNRLCTITLSTMELKYDLNCDHNTLQMLMNDQLFSKCHIGITPNYRYCVYVCTYMYCISLKVTLCSVNYACKGTLTRV